MSKTKQTPQTFKVWARIGAGLHGPYIVDSGGSMTGYAEEVARQLYNAADADPELKMTMLLERGARVIRGLCRVASGGSRRE